MNTQSTSLQDQAKARFVAAHLYGQPLVEYITGVGPNKDKPQTINVDSNFLFYFTAPSELLDYRIQLKRVENITDEHYFEASRIAFPMLDNIEERCGVPAAKAQFLKTMTDRNAVSIQNLSVVNLLGVIEFLRQAGYLIPWNGITCEELVMLGWVQIVE